MYRRLASCKVNNAGNSHVEHAPNAYEMSSRRNSQHTYSTIQNVQSEASAPATSTTPAATNAAENGRTQPSAKPSRSSANDLTLVDNDLYE